jgi:hypothetical protein
MALTRQEFPKITQKDVEYVLNGRIGEETLPASEDHQRPDCVV